MISPGSKAVVNIPWKKSSAAISLSFVTTVAFEASAAAG
jgi:hypothetical protein